MRLVVGKAGSPVLVMHAVNSPIIVVVGFRAHSGVFWANYPDPRHLLRAQRCVCAYNGAHPVFICEALVCLLYSMSMQTSFPN